PWSCWPRRCCRSSIPPSAAARDRLIAAAMRPRIFITQPIAASAIERLRAVADVTVNPVSSRILGKAALREAIKDHDILYALLHDVVDREVLDANPKLKAIAS